MRKTIHHYTQVYTNIRKLFNTLQNSTEIITTNLTNFAKLDKSLTKRYKAQQNFAQLLHNVTHFFISYTQLYNTFKKKTLHNFTTLYKALHNSTQFYKTSTLYTTQPNLTQLYTILQDSAQLYKTIQHSTQV